MREREAASLTLRDLGLCLADAMCVLVCQVNPTARHLLLRVRVSSRLLQRARTRQRQLLPLRARLHRRRLRFELNLSFSTPQLSGA